MRSMAVALGGLHQLFHGDGATLELGPERFNLLQSCLCVGGSEGLTTSCSCSQAGRCGRLKRSSLTAAMA